jgi:photosystem II stability/assembly factor-like uncharacterized protein
MLSDTVYSDSLGKKFTVPFILVVLFLLFLTDFSVFAQHSSIWDRVPEKIRNRNSFKRYEWFMRPRMFPYDTLPIYTFRAELKKEMEKDRLNKGNGFDPMVWNNIGPSGIIFGELAPHWGEVSGRIRGIAVHPTDPNTVYIAVSSGGIWKTTDGGQSWSDIASDLPSLSYGAIAIDPNNPNIVYAGGGEIEYGIGWPWYFDGSGVYKSTNGGSSWIQITNGVGTITSFGDIEVSPHNSNIVFAALGNGNLFSGNFTGTLPNEGIWRSTDYGLTWNRTLDVIDAFDIIVHPTDPNIVYAATGGGVTTAGFYKSTDAGLTWTLSSNGLPSTSNIKRIQISLANSNDSTIFAVVYQESGSNPTVAYKSTNGGDTWEHISPGIQLGGYSGTYWYDQGWYDLSIAVNPSNDQQVLIGNVELHQTINGSDFSVKRIPGGTNVWGCPTHSDIQKIVFAPSNSNIVYIGCDGGIYRSTNAGDTWSSINNGIRTIQLYRLASHPTNHDTLIGGAQDNTNFRTFDAGITPWTSFSGGDGMECFFDYINPNTIYFSLQEGVLYKSLDLGNTKTWLGTFSGFWITPFIMDPINNQYLYVATTNIYKSINGGSTFDPVALNVATEPVISMAQSPVNPSNMIICGGYFIGYVKVSSDGGYTWTSCNIPGDPTIYMRVTCHPTDANTLYLVKTGFSAGNKLYITTDLGANWNNVSGDLPDVPQSDLFIDPLFPTDYYVANDLGVYRSTNSGVNWVRQGIGMPFVPVIDFDYVDFGNEQRVLRAGTHGRSIYESFDLRPVPVELTSFTATTQADFVELNWTTAAEINNQGFEVQRSTINSEFITVGFVEGYGTTTEEHHYSFKDKDVSGFLRYRLKQVDFDGSFEYSDIVEVEMLGAVSYELAQNYPNPFNPITNISYTLPAESQVKLSIYNPLGELVETIVNEKQGAGKYGAVWNAGNYPSGVYMYTLDAVSVNGSEQTKISKKMILLK